MTPALIASLLIAACASALGAERDQSIDVQFPDLVGKLRLKARFEFPQKALGVNYPYERPQGILRGSVFVYTGGVSAILSGTESPAVRQHFDQIIREVKSLQTLGQAKSVTMSSGSTETTKYPGCGPQFLWKSYVLDLGAAKPLKAYTYLTAMNSHFVKLRITLNEEGPQDQRDVEEFVVEMRKVLGRC